MKNLKLQNVSTMPKLVVVTLRPACILFGLEFDSIFVKSDNFSDHYTSLNIYMLTLETSKSNT